VSPIMLGSYAPRKMVKRRVEGVVGDVAWAIMRSKSSFRRGQV
jgi:hypothetical protein